MTRAELIEVIYRFYPRGLSNCGLGYHDTEERQRQRDVARRGRAGYPTWSAMLRRLETRYEIDSSLSYCLKGEYYIPGYSAEIEIPGHTLGVHVSLLGPYYGIQHTGVPDEEPAVLDLAREVEAAYSGYAPIPPELGDEVMPDVEVEHQHFGEATIYNLVLSPDWHPYTAADRERDRALAAQAQERRLLRPPSGHTIRCILTNREPGVAGPDPEAGEPPDEDASPEGGDEPPGGDPHR